MCIEKQNDDNSLIWFDSLGFYCPIEIMEKAKGDIMYSSKQIQDMSSTSCGWYCIAFIKNDDKNPHINSESNLKHFINLFSNDTRKNDSILRRYINT